MRRGRLHEQLTGRLTCVSGGLRAELVASLASNTGDSKSRLRGPSEVLDGPGVRCMADAGRVGEDGAEGSTSVWGGMSRGASVSPIL